MPPFKTIIENFDLTAEIPEPLYVMRLWRDERELHSSLQNFGTLSDPLLFEADTGLKIIDGAERLRFLKQLGRTTTRCQIIPHGEMSTEQAFLVAVELNRTARAFNCAERAHLIREAQKIWRDGKIPKVFWEQIDVTMSLKNLQSYRDFLKLPEVIQKHAVKNDLPVSVALQFLRFPAEEREILANKLFVLPLNQNKLAETLTLLWEIARRESVFATSILESIFTSDFGGGSAMTLEARLRTKLKARRNPLYEQVASEFSKSVNQLSLPEGTRLDPTPFFEDNHVHLNATLTCFADLERLAECLKNPKWRDFFPEE